VCAKNIDAVRKSLARESRDLVVVQMDARSVPLGGGAVPDLVLIDPPRELISEIAPRLFKELSEVLAPKPDAIGVFEYPGACELAPEASR
jgi:16S rRNA (guanine966-N2)-methyltransferase